MGSVSLCRDEVNSSPHLPCQADPLSGSDGCCLAPHLNAGGVHPPQWCYPGPSNAWSPPVSSSPRSVILVVTPGLVVTGGPCRAAPLVPPLWWLKPGGLLAPGTVGVCGSMAAGHTWNSDSWREPPRGIRRSPALSTGSGPFIRGPHAAACQRLHGRLVGSTACGLVLRSLVGAIGWSQRPPGTPGVPPRPGALCAPSI
jgi:hypothetical protein